MEKMYQYIKTGLVNFKLESCCWIMPVRVGIFVITYFNILISLISLVGTANESLAPPIMKIQEIILEDNASKPIPILAYSTELGFNVLLLCAMYRKDTVLLRVFMYYCIVSIVASTLAYSMVLAAIDVILTLTVVFGILFQIYILILVRSAIVEIKAEVAPRNGKLPQRYVFSTLKEAETVPVKNDPIIEESLSSVLEVNKGREEEKQEIQIEKRKKEIYKDIKQEPKRKEENQENKEEIRKKEANKDVKLEPKCKDEEKQEIKVDIREKEVNKDVKVDLNSKEELAETKLETVEEHPSEGTIEVKA